MKKPLVRNAANEKQVKRAGDREQLRQETDIDDLKKIMSTVHGRRFVRRLIVTSAGLLRSSYLGAPTGRGSDPVFLEGRRSVGIDLHDELSNHCFDKWMLALAEDYELKRHELAAINDEELTDDN